MACRFLCGAAWLAAGAVQAESWSNDTDVSWYSAGPSVYSVGTAQQLAGLAKLVNEGNTFAGKTILLTANADLGGKLWTPAGVWDNTVEANNRPFCGIFDGQGWTIDGLTVALTNAQSCVAAGFFGSLTVSATSTGTVKNVILTNLSVASHTSSGDAYAAGVTAHGVKGIVLNSVVAGSVSAATSNGTAYAGGVAGYIEYAFISNCAVSIAVSSVVKESASYRNVTGKAGGVMGDMSTSSSIVGCTVSGIVSGVVSDSSGFLHAGGVAGTGYAGSIQDCAFSGTVDASCEVAGGRLEAGGIIGGNQNGTIRDCAFTGGVTASSGVVTVSCAGGMAGKNYYGLILNSMASGTVTAVAKSHSYAGGVTGDDVSGSSWNCSAAGSASAFSSAVGAGAHAGLVASLDSGSISNCLALSSVSATSTGATGVAYAGGLAGRIVSGKAGYSYWKRTGEAGFDREASGGGAVSGPCLSFGPAPGTLTNAVTVPGLTAATNLLLALNQFAIMRNNANPASTFKFWAVDGVRNGGYPFLTETDPRIAVTFNAQGGVFAGGQTVTNIRYFANEPYGAFPAVARIGNFLTAWTNPAGVAMTVESTVTAEGTNLYAQWGAAEITPDKTTITIGSAGVDDYAVGVASNIPWTVTAGAAWIGITTTVAGFTMDVSANPVNEERSTNIVLLASDYAQYPVAATVTVTQAASGFVPAITPGETAIAIGCGGTNGYAVGVASNIAWTIATGAAWISMTPTADGFTFDAASNEAVVSRAVAIVLQAVDLVQFPVAATVTVTQAASPVMFGGFEHGDSIQAPYPAGSGTNGFTGNSPWTVETGEAWISLLPPLSGTGNGRAVWTLDANSGSVARVATVRVVQTGESGALTNSFTITQVAGAVDVTFNAAGGAFEGGHTVTTVTYAMNVAYGHFPEAARFGMVFDGWANGAVVLTTGMPVAPAPTTVLARWNAEAAAPVVLPPSQIGARSFVARWRWVEGRAPEGELAVAADAAFTKPVTGYAARYVLNASDSAVAGLVLGKDYWYRVRRIYPDGLKGAWSASMKVRTGTGMPRFPRLLSDGPVAKGITQQFVLTNLVAGTGVLTVKSSDTASVKPTQSGNSLVLQYLWNGANTVRLTLALEATGYKVSYGVTLNRAYGSLSVNAGPLIPSGQRAMQDLTVVNQTGVTVYGVRIRAMKLDNPAWLINRTGVDPVSKASIREIPCVLKAGEQVVVRLIYKAAYQTQARTRPATYGAWAILTPVDAKAGPAAVARLVAPQALYDGLWLFGLPGNRNRLYTVEWSDDDGASWTLEPPAIRAAANYLMWLDPDDQATENRIYRVTDVGL